MTPEKALTLSEASLPQLYSRGTVPSEQGRGDEKQEGVQQYLALKTSVPHPSKENSIYHLKRTQKSQIPFPLTWTPEKTSPLSKRQS